MDISPTSDDRTIVLYYIHCPRLMNLSLYNSSINKYYNYIFLFWYYDWFRYKPLVKFCKFWWCESPAACRMLSIYHVNSHILTILTASTGAFVTRQLHTLLPNRWLPSHHARTFLSLWCDIGNIVDISQQRHICWSRPRKQLVVVHTCHCTSHVIR